MRDSGDQVKEELPVEVDASFHGEDSESSFFSEGERVLALHEDRLYDAKILKGELKNGKWRYFVHYHGWNSKWDEWLEIDSLFKRTKENFEKQRTLSKKRDPEKIEKSECNMRINSEDSSVTQAKKRKSDLAHKVDPDESKKSKYQRIMSEGLTVIHEKKRKTDSPHKKLDAPVKNLIDIQISLVLKKQLVSDWQFMTQQHKIVKLPCSATVDQILNGYLEYILKNNGTLTDSIGEILKGLRCYFNHALPVMLLYKGERLQYQETIVDTTSPSTVYGAQHLLRLFVKLPELLTCVNLDKKTTRHLQETLSDLLRYLKKNRSSFFTSSSYDCPSVSQASSNTSNPGH